MEYEYEVHDGDEYFAGVWNKVSEDKALEQAYHYAAQCENPKIYRVTKELISA